jgi:N-acetylglucosamine-6-phosphate deacetylase
VGIIATVPNGRGGLYRARIATSDGRIAAVYGYRSGSPAGKEDLDFTPHVALPGFIDLQLNGAFGYDITADPSSMWAIGTRLAEHGVTAFLPTVVTSAPARRQAAYGAIRSRPPGHRGAEPVGIHVEGPALSPSFPGTHPPEWLAPDADELADEIMAEHDIVRLVTLAPETENAPGAISRLVRAGVAVSLGHTGATAEQAQAALEAGASAFTHLFNAMAPLHHREVGAAGAALLHPTAAVSLIADGHHLSDEALLLAWRLAGPERVFLVTDAIAGMAAPAGTYRIGDVSVECGDTARNPSGGLAGSLLTMPGAARRLRAATGASWDDLAAVTAANQARLLGDASRGALLPGCRADLAVVDARLQPVATVIAGEVVWRRRDRGAETATAPASPARKEQEPDPAATVEAVRNSTREARPRRSDSTHTLPTAIGVDIGGTTFKAAVFDGAVLGPVRRGATGKSRPPGQVLAEVREVIDGLAVDAHTEIHCLGIACPGIVEPATGRVVDATNLRWRDVDVAGALGRGLGAPVALEHDVYLAALAEWETGAGVGAASMLYVSVGTGVASRLFTHGTGTERGSASLAGEMGFIALGSPSRPLENAASGTALQAAYRVMTGRTLRASEIIAAASRDPAAARATDAAMSALARGVAAAVCLQDPEIIVMGGGVPAADGALLAELAPRVGRMLAPLRGAPPIVAAAHGAHSGVVGAALHATRVLPG